MLGKKLGKSKRSNSRFTLGIKGPRLSRANRSNSRPGFNIINPDFNLAKPKRSQSEMVGFVLIVVLVIVAIMVFLVISIKSKKEVESKDVENMLSSIMSYTTDCAIVSEPRYDSVEDLIKSCFDNDKCSNLNKMACDYLEELMTEIMNDVIRSEGAISGYALNIISRFGEEENGFFSVSGGNLTGVVLGGQRVVSSGGVKLVARLTLSYD